MGIDLGAERNKRATREQTQLKPSSERPPTRSAPGRMLLDCSACKNDRTMEPTKVHRFGGFIRLIGYIIVLPSVLGVVLAVILFIGGTSATSDVINTATSDAEKAGAAIGGAMTFGFAIFLGGASLVGGLVGYLLLISKKVWRCITCGYIIERA